MNADMELEKNKLGTEVEEPLVSTSRLSISVHRTSRSASASFKAGSFRRSAKPLSLSNPKILWMRGLRRSASIRRTLELICAMACAKLEAAVVLPSDGPALVMTRTRGLSPLLKENRMEATTPRKLSPSSEGSTIQADCPLIRDDRGEL